MEAGRELDFLIHREVMRKEVEPGMGGWPNVPPYSTDVRAAWEVGQQMHKRDAADGRYSRFARRWLELAPLVFDYSESETAHAICLAALEAIGYDPSNHFTDQSGPR